MKIIQNTYFIFIFILCFKPITKAQILNKIDSLLSVSESYLSKKEYNKAIEICNEAENSMVNNSENSILFGKVYNQIGKIYFTKNDNAEAIKYFLKSLPLIEPSLSTENIDYILASKSLATAYLRLTQYEKAKPIFEKIIQLREKYQGKNHPDYANGLMNLGLLYNRMSDYSNTEKNYLLAKDVFDKNPNKLHPVYQGLLINMANLYKDLALYQKAEPLFVESISIAEQIHGKNSAIYSANLLDAAIMYQNLGNYRKADNYYIEAINIDEKNGETEKPDYANKLMNYANLCADLGLYEKAEKLQLRAKEIIVKLFGKEHPWYSSVLNNLAGVYTLNNKHIEAETLYLETIKIKENQFGKLHPSYATSLLSLAELYLKMNKSNHVQALLSEAMTIYETKLGKESPNYTDCLIATANLKLLENNYEKAKIHLTEAQQILRKLYGKNHPSLPKILTKLGNINFNQNNLIEAKLNFKEASELTQEHILLRLNHLSEKEMEQYLASINEQEAAIYSFNQNTGSQTDISEISYNNAIFRKGFLLNAYYQMKNVVQKNEKLKEKYQLIQFKTSQLNKELTKPLLERKNTNQLEQSINELQKDLANIANIYGDATKQIKWSQIKQKLNKGEAAIEFVLYKYFNKNTTDTINYAALILLPNIEKPIFIRLFPENQILKLINPNQARKADYVNSLYNLADRGVGLQKEEAPSLYQLIWEPILKNLENVTKIYFSPSGLLHRINFDAIPISENETLADKYKLIQLNNTRQLVFNDKFKNDTLKSVIYGGIRFGEDSLLNNSENRNLKKGAWNYLPGTMAESQLIHNLFKNSGYKTELKVGVAATEDSFKEISSKSNSPKIIHIATHGYFFEENTPNQGNMADQASIFKTSENAMLRSGLILANGNVGWTNGLSSENKEDGVLTALEISQMDFSKTEMVVLSACETGLGAINNNEGVYGLQRAFKIAGAKYIIMSLWQVPDKHTSKLMSVFYSNLLTDKQSIPDAFHNAQKSLREAGLDPFYWAGFVLVE